MFEKNCLVSCKISSESSQLYAYTAPELMMVHSSGPRTVAHTTIMRCSRTRFRVVSPRMVPHPHVRFLQAEFASPTIPLPPPIPRPSSPLAQTFFNNPSNDWARR